MRPILLLLACALLVACNSDDGGGLSAGEYREKANELCEQANREAQRLDTPRSAGELADFLERGLALARKWDRRMEELEPPDELRRLHERAIRVSDDLEVKFERLIERVRTADEPLIEFQNGIQRLLADIQEGDDINRRLKLDQCLEVPGLRGTGPGPS